MIMEGAEPFFLPGGSMGVLLVHGFTGLPAELSMMGEYLQQRGCTVLGVRLAGHGTTVEDMSRMTAEDWLDSVRDGYALLRGSCERVVVAGHSMGGLLALLLAAEKAGKDTGLAGVISMAAPIYIAQERGIGLLPPRSVSVGVFVPKARRRLKNVPPAANHTYRKMPLISVHELLDVIDYSNRKFAVLLPDEEDAEDVIIMEIQDYDSDVNTFLSVDSESTRRAVFELFRTKNSDRFDFE